MPYIHDADAIAYITGLAEAEQSGSYPRTTFTMGPFTGFVMIAALQVAMRHPDMSPVQRETVDQLLAQARPMFAGTPAELILSLGADLQSIADEAIGDCTVPADILEPDEDCITRVEVAHPIVYEGNRVKVTVGAEQHPYTNTWLRPDDADQLARNLISRAAEARRRDARDAEIERRGAEAARWLADNPPAAP